MRQPFGLNIHSSRMTVLFLFLLQLSPAVVAQDFGRFRPGIKWYQVDAPQVRVIFPKGLEMQAGRVANNITHLELNARSGIGSRTRNWILS
jgi:hypothetical protein